MEVGFLAYEKLNLRGNFSEALKNDNIILFSQHFTTFLLIRTQFRKTVGKGLKKR